MQNKVEYVVKTNEEHDLAFDRLTDARAYKKTLKNSQRRLKGVIVRREYVDEYILDERLVR